MSKNIIKTTWDKTTDLLVKAAKLKNENITKKELAKEQLKKLNAARPNKEKDLLEQEMSELHKEFLLYLFTIILGE